MLFTADHGESLGEQGVYWDHTSLYPSTLQVPLFIRGPGVASGKVVDLPVSNVNVGRTQIELAGLRNKDFPGISLLDEKARTAAAREPRFVVGQNGYSAGVYAENWYLVMFLVRYPFGKNHENGRHRIQLFDRSADPYCEHDVTEQHPQVAKRLRKALVAWLSVVPEQGHLTGELPATPAAREDVTALGYAADGANAIEGALIDSKCRCPEFGAYR
jgi:arylsulfatase A-like enzyme